MKKFKISFVMLLSLALVFTVSPIVYAQNVENITFETVSHMEEHHLEAASVSPRYTCGYCFATENAVIVCRGEEMMLPEREYHSISQGGTCTVFLYQSTCYLGCPKCGRELESFPYHICKKFHVNCGLGSIYPECPARYPGL